MSFKNKQRIIDLCKLPVRNYSIYSFGNWTGTRCQPSRLTCYALTSCSFTPSTRHREGLLHQNRRCWRLAHCVFIVSRG